MEDVEDVEDVEDMEDVEDVEDVEDEEMDDILEQTMEFEDEDGNLLRMKLMEFMKYESHIYGFLIPVNENDQVLAQEPVTIVEVVLPEDEEEEDIEYLAVEDEALLDVLFDRFMEDIEKD